jgi:uncharacterized protein
MDIDAPMRPVPLISRALACALLWTVGSAGAATSAGATPPATDTNRPATRASGPTTTPSSPPTGTVSSGRSSATGATSKAGVKSVSRSKPGGASTAKAPPPKAKPKQKPGEVLEVDWRDLLPANERSHYSAAAPPPQHGPLGEGGPPAVQKQTTTFNEDLADMVVRLPGFVVPVGSPQKGLITEFFLVPYIGACIHVPPPPPNQMVYVTSASGIAADAIHEAYWVTGKMRVESRTTALGTAAYALSATKVELYEY